MTIRTPPPPLRPRSPAGCWSGDLDAPFVPLPFLVEEGEPRIGRGPLDAAQAAWEAHLAAGRIGVAVAPPPAPAGSDYGLASLAALLRPARAERVW